MSAGDGIVFCGRRIGGHSVVTFTGPNGTHLLPLATWKGQRVPREGFAWGDRSIGAQCLALSLAVQIFGESIGRACSGHVLDTLVQSLNGPAWEISGERVRRAGLIPIPVSSEGIRHRGAAR